MGCFIRPDALSEEVIEAQKKESNGYKIKQKKVMKLYEPDLFPKYL